MPDFIAIRDAYGHALRALGEKEPQVVVLEADAGSSSKSLLFGQRFPDRYFNVGIAEMNMVAMAAGFILQYMAKGTVWVEDRLRILPVVWIGGGLLLAALTGTIPILLGDAFLTSYFQYLELPLVGKVPLASASVFDLGVFSLVVGATVLMLIAIAHQSIRRLRAARLEEERQLEERQLWS